MGNPETWHDWDETMEYLIPGFANIPTSLQDETIDRYRSYVPVVRELLNDKGYYLMRDRRGNLARFKVALPEDRERVEKMLNLENGNIKGAKERFKDRVENAKEKDILPEGWKPKALNG